MLNFFSFKKNIRLQFYVKILVISQRTAAASVLCFSLTHCFLFACLHLLFSPPPDFDTASMYSTLASVLSFKQWSQAKGTFCFSCAQNQLN